LDDDATGVEAAAAAAPVEAAPPPPQPARTAIAAIATTHTLTIRIDFPRRQLKFFKFIGLYWLGTIQPFCLPLVASQPRFNRVGARLPGWLKFYILHAVNAWQIGIACEHHG